MPSHWRQHIHATSPEEDHQCRLLGPTALVVQALMGILVILSLVYKRHREKPRRKWKIWIFDVSKQVIGQAILHGSNVLISWLVGRRTMRNPCVTYFLNILLDTTLGVLIIYSLLQLFAYLLVEKSHLKGFKTGVYGNPPSIIWWLKQASVYFLAVLIMKTCVILLLEFVPWFIKIGNWLLSWTGGRNGIQVVFVMGIFPIAMNILQFWMIDSIVKFKMVLDDHDQAVQSTTEDREPLVGPDELSDDDGDVIPRRSAADLERGAFVRPSSAAASTATLDSNLVLNKEGDDASPPKSPDTSSSRTVTMIRRRSPPPSPSHTTTPSSSYGSVDEDGAIRSPRHMWGARNEDESEHAKWGRSLMTSRDEAGHKSPQGLSVDSATRPRSPSSVKRWESWRMPVVGHPANQPKR